MLKLKADQRSSKRNYVSYLYCKSVLHSMWYVIDRVRVLISTKRKKKRKQHVCSPQMTFSLLRVQWREIKMPVKSYELTALSQKTDNADGPRGHTQCKNVKRCSQQYFKHDSNISLHWLILVARIEETERASTWQKGQKVNYSRGRNHTRDYGKQESLQLPQHFG